MTRLLLIPITLYRMLISPLLGPHCRFYPTCSVYASEAIERHGALKGGLLSLRRICRCHPGTKTGFIDPVPERLEWRGLFQYKRSDDER